MSQTFHKTPTGKQLCDILHALLTVKKTNNNECDELSELNEMREFNVLNEFLLKNNISQDELNICFAKTIMFAVYPNQNIIKKLIIDHDICMNTSFEHFIACDTCTIFETLCKDQEELALFFLPKASLTYKSLLNAIWGGNVRLVKALISHNVLPQEEDITLLCNPYNASHEYEPREEVCELFDILPKKASVVATLLWTLCDRFILLDNNEGRRKWLSQLLHHILKTYPVNHEIYKVVNNGYNLITVYLRSNYNMV
jgi:hypothetical protein